MKNDVYRRVNVSLPGKTLKRIDRVAEHGDRSRFINVAVNFYLTARSRENLRKTLKEGAQARAERDIEIAEELFGLGDTWEEK